MKRSALLTVLLIAVVLTVAGCGKKNKYNERVPAPAAEQTEAVDMTQYMPSLEIQAPAPEIEAPDIAGKNVKLSDFRGKYVVLDFWATWCKDCRAEMPAMKQLYDKYGPKDVAFVGVSFDTDTQTLMDYGLENEIPWLVVCNGIKWKENPISAAYDIKWIPTLYLIDPEGNVAGINFHAADMDALLEEVLKN